MLASDSHPSPADKNRHIQAHPHAQIHLAPTPPAEEALRHAAQGLWRSAQGGRHGLFFPPSYLKIILKELDSFHASLADSESLYFQCA